MVSEKVRLSVVPPASTTPTFTEKVPVSAVVPEMTPVLAPMPSPLGSPVADHDRGGVPPVRAIVALYATFASPSGNVVEVIEIAPLMTTV